MKRIIIIAGIVVSGLFSSCQDFEDEYFDTPAKSSLDESVIFSTPALAKGAIDGIKEPFGGTDSYRGRWLPYYGLNSDVEWLNSTSPGAKADLVTYDAKSTNTEMSKEINVWAQMYSGIERANICIRGLRNYGNPTPGSELGYLLGEALTLRSIYYADLLRSWGDVPARFEPITSATIYVPKTNRDVIYKQLLKDLEEAATLVPWPNGSDATKDVQRVNKAFVKGLRARLAMVASGYQQYPDGGGFGVVRRSNDPELSQEKMDKLALDECLDVIANGKSHLEPTFEGLWRKYNEESTVAGGESLWEIPFGDVRGRFGFTFAVLHNTKDQFQGYGKVGGSAGPLPTVFYDFDESDTRRSVTCVPYFYANANADGIARQELGKLNTWYFGKYRYEWMIRKVGNTTDDGLNKVYMRYAEVLLMAAEAANRLEGPTAAAPYLKLIRKRAFKIADHATKVDAYVDALTTKEAMFNAIVDEHKYEFTGEMERKQALIRWNLLKDKLDEAKSKMLRLQDRSGEYATVPKELHYKYKADNVTLDDVYGLNRGEITPPVGYTAVAWTWSGTEAIKKANFLFKEGTDPNTRQFWPIWAYFIANSNGQLINDYNFE